MKIIALKGRGECGKSETIGVHLRAVLTGKEYPRNEWNRRKDVRECISYVDKLIDICPPGDNADIVEANIAFIKEHPCDVVFTATRTRGGSWDTLLEFTKKDGTELIEEWKHYDDALDKEGQTEENRKLAKKLLKMI